MVNSSNVDIKAFYERYSRLYGRKASRVWKTGEQEYHGSCPWCGGTDRFMFRSPSGRYSCKIRSSGCGKHGRDVIDFLRDYEDMDFLDACEYLEIDPGSEYIHSERTGTPLDAPPSRVWLERAMGVVHKAQRYLWAPQGRQAREYLHERGFTDEAIRAANLGYIPLVDGKWYKDSADLWGISFEEGEEDSGIWIPEGILIPWYINGDIWRLNVRRLTGWHEGHAKYLSISGGSEALYNADSIKAECTVVLCESELDALAGHLGYGSDDVIFVATGSTSRARRAKWIAKLSMASCVLVAFDDDPLKNGKRAGDAGAKLWTDILPNALRWTPWAHDVNDMLKESQDIQKWVSLGREVHQAMQTPVVAIEPEEEVLVCVDCSVPITDESREFFFSDDGTCYCSLCRDEAGQPLPRYIPEPIETEEQFTAIVERIVAEVFDGNCTVIVNPPGYTLADRVQELAAERESAQADFWKQVRAKVLRPPVDRRGRPYYTADEWIKKYEELINKVPDRKLTAHR